MESRDDRRESSKDQSSAISIPLALKYGAIAGFISTWSITSAIAASEYELGLPISTFYAVMGIALGSDNAVSAAYVGFGMHLATGTLLGSLIGFLAVKVERLRNSNMANIFNPYRAVAMGMATGILVWAVLFLPVTVLLIQPSEEKIAEVLPLEGSGTLEISQSFRGIAISAILFHVVWGAIFGFVINSLLRIRLAKSQNSSTAGNSGEYTDRSLRIAYFGLVAGVISSLAISGMILLVEKVMALPVGTFYYVLVAGLTNSYSGNFSAAVGQGLVMHLLAGSFMGLVMALPFMLVTNEHTYNKRRGFVMRFAPFYGLAFGFGLWLLVFLPVSYFVVVPFLTQFENQDVFIGQRVPTGEASSATFFRMLQLTDRIVYGALAFNMFYGLLVGIMVQSFSEKSFRPGKTLKPVESVDSHL